jgi:hypothetical protein
VARDGEAFENPNIGVRRSDGNGEALAIWVKGESEGLAESGRSRSILSARLGFVTVIVVLEDLGGVGP